MVIGIWGFFWQAGSIERVPPLIQPVEGDQASPQLFLENLSVLLTRIDT